MKKVFSIIITVCVAFCNSCTITTLYPIFKENDIIFSTKLLGYWKFDKNSKDSDYIEIEKVPTSILNELPDSLQKLAGNGYLITRTDQQHNIITRHLAFLLDIGKYHYLDYYPLETDEEKNYYDFYKVHYIRMHTFYRINFITDKTFELKQFDEDYIHRLIDAKQIRVRYECRLFFGDLWDQDGGGLHRGGVGGCGAGGQPRDLLGASQLPRSRLPFHFR